MGKITGMRRYLSDQIERDLQEKMVLLAGPRQVGKTTLAKSLIKSSESYLNWDADEDRAKILAQRLPNTPIWVFDEIHKYPRWRGFLKGLVDKEGRSRRILVTGSARLDYYRRGGDSLQGRYHFLRMYPLTVAELGLKSDSDFMGLLELGGFPEPFLGQRKEAADRWSNQYRSRVVRDEIRDLETVADVTKLELLSFRIPDSVGSPLSINALREDLEVAHKTVARWVEILERIYVVFRVLPFGSPKVKAVKKESKAYLYDWNSVEGVGSRFENMVALHLLKWCHWQEDVFGKPYELRFFRDIEGREVDFVITLRREPVLFLECKWAETAVHPPLLFSKRKFPKARAIQLVGQPPREFVTPDGIEVLSARKFLAELS